MDNLLLTVGVQSNSFKSLITSMFLYFEELQRSCPNRGKKVEMMRLDGAVVLLSV